MDRALVVQLRERGIAVVGGLREGLSSIARRALPAGQTHRRGHGVEQNTHFAEEIGAIVLAL
jgi:hypothetical protein